MQLHCAHSSLKSVQLCALELLTAQLLSCVKCLNLVLKVPLLVQVARRVLFEAVGLSTHPGRRSKNGAHVQHLLLRSLSFLSLCGCVGMRQPVSLITRARHADGSVWHFARKDLAEVPKVLVAVQEHVVSFRAS